MYKHQVLVSGSANVTGMNVIRALIAEHIDVIGCDFNKDNPANKFCHNEIVPRCSDPDYFPSIVSIIDKFHITHIVASNDHDVRSLMMNLSQLILRGVKLNGACENTLLCLDKSKTAEIFFANGILTPQILTSDTDYPLVLRKLSMGSDKKFVHILKSEKDRKAVEDDQFKKGILTRFIEGDEYTIDVLCSDESKVLSAVPRLRMEVRSGMVYHAQIVKDEKMIEAVVQICKKLKLKGMSCIQCIKNNDQYYFIEINPRPGSGIDLTINSGVNMPALWVQDKTNDIPQPNWNLKMLRYFEGYYFE